MTLQAALKAGEILLALKPQIQSPGAALGAIDSLALLLSSHPSPAVATPGRALATMLSPGCQRSSQIYHSSQKSSFSSSHAGIAGLGELVCCSLRAVGTLADPEPGEESRAVMT